jgi:type III secretion system FlhB-like substrate exporter
MSNLMQAHKQWASRPQDQRFQTIEDLYASVNRRRMHSRTADIDIGSISAKVEGGAVLLNHGINSVEPSHWSFGQLSGWIHAPAGYLRSLPGDLMTQNLNYGIQKHAPEVGELKFMTVVSEKDDENNILQAVTATTYGRIWDADVVSCAKRIVERTNGKFYNPKAFDPYTGQPVPSGLYASDRDVFIFMIDGGSVLDAGPRAQLNRGFFMWNSETGARTFGLTTFLFNTVCGNHIVWGAQDIRELRIRHTKNGPTRFDTDAAPTLMAYASGSAAPEIAAIKKAQEYLLPAQDRDDIIKWLQTKKFTKTEATETYDTAMEEEGDCRTLWQVIQGATAYARGFDFVDARVELETKAGKLMEIVAPDSAS